MEQMSELRFPGGLNSHRFILRVNVCVVAELSLSLTHFLCGTTNENVSPEARNKINSHPSVHSFDLNPVSPVISPRGSTSLLVNEEELVNILALDGNAPRLLTRVPQDVTPVNHEPVVYSPVLPNLLDGVLVVFVFMQRE